jgi:hypothetical protein
LTFSICSPPGHRTDAHRPELTSQAPPSGHEGQTDSFDLQLPQGRLESRLPAARPAAVRDGVVSEKRRDERTGRPLDEAGREAIESLSDEELEAELTIAAAPPNGLRRERYEALLREKARRARRS